MKFIFKYLLIFYLLFFRINKMNKILKIIFSLIYIIQNIICINDNTIKLKISNDSSTYFKTFNCVISNEKIEKKNKIFNDIENKTYFYLTGIISLNISHILVPDLAQIENKIEENGYNSNGTDDNLKTEYKASTDLYLEYNKFNVSSSFYLLQTFIFNNSEDKIDDLKLQLNFISLKNNIFNDSFNDEFNNTYDYSIFGLNYIPNDENNEPYSFFSLLKNIEKTIFIKKTGDETELYIGNVKDNSKDNRHILVTFNNELYYDLGWSSFIQYLIFENFNKTDEKNFTKVAIPLNESNSVLFNYNNYQNFHIFPFKKYFDIFKEKYFDNLTDSNCFVIYNYNDTNDNNYTIFKCHSIKNRIFGFIINGTFINLTEKAFNIPNEEDDEYTFKIYFSNNTNYIYFDLNHFLDEKCDIKLKVEDVNFNYIPKIIIKGDFLEDVSLVSPIIKDDKLSLKGIYKLIFLGVVMFILVVLLVIRHWLKIKGKNDEENNDNNLIDQ